MANERIFYLDKQMTHLFKDKSVVFGLSEIKSAEKTTVLVI